MDAEILARGWSSGMVSASDILGEFIDQGELLDIACREGLSPAARLMVLRAWANYEEGLPLRDPKLGCAVERYLRSCIVQLAGHLPGNQEIATSFVEDKARSILCSTLQPTWAWPVVNETPGAGKLSADWAPYSALKMFGYTVGKTSGWPAPKRRQFLCDFMERDLPATVPATFGTQYGKPMSTDRLRKVANVIASNLGNFMRNDAKKFAVAIKDYQDDLAFLKRTYFEGKGLKFQPWPDPRANA